MSEFSISKKAGFSCVSQFFHFFFFLLSHPLYFSYFIFFFPYILSLLSFLSPLFITTSLLLSALLTVSPALLFDNRLRADQSPESIMSFLATTYQIVFDSLRPRIGDEIEEFPPLEEFEAYKIVFETYTFETGESPYDDVPEVDVEVDCQEPVEISSEKMRMIFPEDPAPCEERENEAEEEIEVNALGSESDKGEVRKEDEAPPARSESEAMEKEIKDFRRLTDNYGEESVSVSSRSESSPWKTKPCEKKRENEAEEEKEVNALDSQSKKGEAPPARSESKAMEKEIREFRRLTDNYSEETLSVSSRSESSPWSSPSSFGRENSLGSYGSMRKEKEWRRTLACKLFEERHNADGTEGMDSLWETYEKSETKKLQKNPGSKTKRGKKIEEHEEEEDDEEERNAQLCCLQALKFSAGKMNLGMGRPIVKMSKALKGFGWLSRSHGKKKV